jgi:hypothetical protein
VRLLLEEVVMDGPPVQEAGLQIEELIRTVDDLRRRVAALEQRSTVPVLSIDAELPAAESAPLPEVSPSLLAHAGRLLLGMAGAYLLRAITEAGILPELTGTLAGLLYAGAWLMASIRTSGSNRISLALEGLTASAIAAPLLWEATTRLHAISPSGAAAALAFFIVLGQIVAWKHDHSAIAAITAMAGSITAFALMIATLDPVPFVAALLVAAVVVEYGAVREHALAWRWIIALAADFGVCLLAYLVTRPQGPPDGYAHIPIVAVAGVQLTLAAVYLSSTAARTLIREQRFGWFEIVQVTAVMALAVVSNLRLASEVGGALLAGGAACYFAAFSGAARWIHRNFHAFATFSVILVITGSYLLFRGPAVVALWSVVALAAIWFGERQDKTTLSVHGATYLLAAAATTIRLGHYWPVAIAATLAYGVMLANGQRAPSVMHRIPARWLAVSLLAVSTEWARHTPVRYERSRSHSSQLSWDGAADGGILPS